MKRKVVLGGDHRGFPLKRVLVDRLRDAGYEVEDLGPHDESSVDYPDFAAPAARAVSEGHAPLGIVVCGSGLGVSYTANRFPRVRAALVHDVEAAAASREHNDANVLALAGDRLDPEAAWKIVSTWLETPFEGGRHVPRVRKIDTLTRVNDDPYAHLRAADPAIAALVEAEARRQFAGLELIASENFVSEAVLEATGSVLTNKYAEGYPGRRYYGGCEVVDEVERLARERATALFGADHANVQPHSGSQANEAAYRALIEPGDTVLGMSLDHGGHLTHGSPVNFSGQTYHFVAYGVERESERIELDRVRELAREHRPKLIQCGTTAYSRTLDFAGFRAIADEVGALLFADIAHIAGLVAAGLHPTPVGHAQVTTTTTHKTLRGPRGGLILCDEAYAAAVDRAVFPGTQGGPLEHVIAGKAVALGEASSEAFRRYSAGILENAKALADALAAKGFPVVSGGTDTHLFLLSLVGRELTGKHAQDRLEAAGITVNKNLVPFDPRSPRVTSGLRFGTPALTTRGMGPDEMREVAELIALVLEGDDDPVRLTAIREQVGELCARFPLYPTRQGGEGEP